MRAYGVMAVQFHSFLTSAIDMRGQTHDNVLSLFLFKYGAMDKVKFWMIPKSSLFDDDSNDHVNNNNNNNKYLTLMVF
jgi:hypothetical protein